LRRSTLLQDKKYLLYNCCFT